MSEVLSFSESYNYDTLKIGITVPAKLFFGEKSVRLEAKVIRARKIAFLNELTQNGSA